jgi:hypothetical protein
MRLTTKHPEKITAFVHLDPTRLELKMGERPLQLAA